MLHLRKCHAFLDDRGCGSGSKCPFWHIVPTAASEEFFHCRQEGSQRASVRPAQFCVAVNAAHEESQGNGAARQGRPRPLACETCRATGSNPFKCWHLVPLPESSSCKECGQAHSEGPVIPWRCYHQGRWNSLRYGGWVLAGSDNPSEWHCCRCEDPTAKNCLEHKVFRTCHCFDRPGEDRRERDVDKLWISLYMELGWPVEELAKVAGLY